MANKFAPFQRGALLQPRKQFMFNERLKKRLEKDRPGTSYATILQRAGRGDLASLGLQGLEKPDLLE